jgi:hypothetical protein
MESEVKEKLEVKQKTKSNTTGITLEGIPLWVHKRVKAFQLKISSELGRKLTVKEAYIEFLKEAAAEK